MILLVSLLLIDLRMSSPRFLCLLGHPVSHSASPAMQSAAIKSAGLDLVYEAFDVMPPALAAKVEELRATAGFLGANVTIPHKVAVMGFLDETDPLAEKVGAVNTIHYDSGKLIGYNTDGYGALMALQEARVRVKEKDVVIIGAGGAARAVVFALACEGKAARVAILNRTKDRAYELAKSVSGCAMCEIASGGLDELAHEIPKADIVVNCTSVGLKSDGSVLDKSLLINKPAVFDIVFNPLMTGLLKDAQSAGCKLVTGDGMLLHQGAKAFEIWTGKAPDVGAMRKALRSFLACEAAA